MDFCYASIALLLFFHGCIGQDATTGATEDAAAAAAAPEANLEIRISPVGNQHQLDVGVPKTFTCTVTSDSSATPVIKWYKDGVEITNTDASQPISIKVSGAKLRLKFASISDDQVGNYECRGSVGTKVVPLSFALEVKKPIKITSAKLQYGIVNEDSVIECIATGRPLPTVNWMYPNGVEIQNNEKFVKQSNGLLVKNLQFEDGKIYRCEAVVEDSGDTVEWDIEYVVVEIPVITMPPSIEPANTKVGDKVVISCKASGIPKPTYSFTKNGNNIPESQIDAVAGTLTIEDLKRTDEAEYNCIASNEGGSDEMANRLDVQIPPTISPINDEEAAAEKQKLTIECVAEGDPAPQVTWRKDGMETEYTTSQDHPQITIESLYNENDELKTVKSLMQFDQLRASDAGKYVCTANNAAGEITEDFQMAVTYKPHFDVPFKESVFYSWAGHTANMTCQASGNPEPTIKWQRKVPAGEGSEVWEDIKTAHPFTLMNLRAYNHEHLSNRDLEVVFTSDDQSLYGEYRCIAENVIGSDNRIVELKQAVPPQKPSVSIGKTLSTRVTLNVAKPDANGGQPVLEYNYIYYVDSEGKEDQKELKEPYSGDNTIITLRDLKPNTTYVVKVAAMNQIGKGTEEPLLITTKTVSVPMKLSIGSKPVSSGATSYNLQWNEPEDGGAPIKHFVVSYRLVTVTNGDKDPSQWQTASDKDEQFTIIKTPNGNARNYQLKDLKRNSYYEVRLTAVNSKGESKPDMRIILTGKGSGAAASDGTDAEGAETGTDNSSSNEEGKAGADAKKSSSASAGLGSGLIIAIIVIIIIIIAAIVVGVVVMKKRKAARGGDAEGGKADDGKAVAESQRLIDDNAKVENENDKGEGIEEKQEYEPDQKPDPAPAPEAADEKPSEETAAEPTIQVTPNTPDKPENPAA